MANTLPHRLKLLMEEKQITISRLERLANLKMSAVRNILSGQSKKPSAETIQAIARVLGCTMEHLMGDEDIDQKGFSTPSIEPINPDIFLKACQMVVEISQQLDINLTFDQLFSRIQDVYTYSSQKEPPLIDEHFVKWLIKSKK